MPAILDRENCSPWFADGVFGEHWDVLHDEATGAESQSGLPVFGEKFPE
jgi:hypothetical protein